MISLLFKPRLLPGIFILGMLASCHQPGTEPFLQQPDIPEDLREKLDHAQNSNVDSAIFYASVILEYIRENNLPDSLYIKFNSVKAFQLVKTPNSNEGLQPLMENYLLAHTLGDSLLVAMTTSHLGNYYNIIYQYSLALPYVELAANYYKQYPHDAEAAVALSNLGKIYQNAGNFYQALENFNLVADILTANKDTQNLAYTLADIGYNMVQLGLNEAALEPTRQGIQLLESLPNGQDIGLTLNNLGINYRTTYPDSAIYYQQKALDLTLELGDSLNWITSLYNMGNSFSEIGKLEAAEKIFLQVYDFCAARNIEQGVTLSYNALGATYLKTGKYTKAIHYATLADAALKKAGSPINVARNLKTLISAHTQIGNEEQAQMLQRTQDSIQNQSQLLQTQSTVKYIEQAIIAGRAAYDNQMLQQKNTAIAALIQWRTYAIIFLLLTLSIGGILWLKWKKDNQYAQQAIDVLLQRYAKDIQQKKLSGHYSAEDSSYPQLAQKLRYLLEAEKIHLQTNLKTEDVLQYLQISYKDLHQLLKSEFNTTFPQLINQYRVNTAQQLLSNPDNLYLSLDEIAILSGFGSRQNFYKTFQSYIGVTPGLFRTYLQNG
jgi:AraC-like DNA-binding protein